MYLKIVLNAEFYKKISIKSVFEDIKTKGHFMLNVITSKDNPKVKWAIKLAKNGTLRFEEGLFFASTPKVVMDILQAGFEATDLFFMQCEYDRYEEKLAEENVYIITNDVNEKMSQDMTSQGVFGVFKTKKPDISAIFSANKLIILEDVQDPGNMGAIMRTALGFGYENVVVSAKCADIYSPKVLRSSMSASVKLNVYKVQDITAFVADLNKKGFCTVAACPCGDTVLGEKTIPLPVAIIIGNEGTGLCTQTINTASYKVKIPMSEKLESLNAAVSAAVVMWQLRGE